MRMGRAKTSSMSAGRDRSTREQDETLLAIRDEFITLAQLLKMTGIVGTGGEAKYYLAETSVRVNGEPEQRRGRKLYPGDLVEPPGTTPVRLILKSDPDKKPNVD